MRLKGEKEIVLKCLKENFYIEVTLNVTHITESMTTAQVSSQEDLVIFGNSF